VCFIVMPFRRRKVEGPVVAGAPAELDCDALWDRVYRPVVEALGYLPVRADADTGSVIVKDMLERLAFAHLVLADVTLPNGNVYYEIGLRHVACETGCVLLATSWSKQLFDIDQFRSIRYPLSDGLVPEEEAAGIRAALIRSIPLMKDARTPWHELVTADQQAARVAAFREQSEEVSGFQARMRAARIAAKGERAARVQSILADVNTATLTIPEIATELLTLVRDEMKWSDVLAFVRALPDNTRSLPTVQEQELLALAETGQPLDAIARLESLVATHGDSAERQGLIGGRYKRLWKQEEKERIARGQTGPSADERRYLNEAIEHYSRGMELDFNLYYCSNNLPLLLRARNKKGDVERAAVVEQFVLAACARALRRGEHDEWLRPTLLGAAFRARDGEKARELADQVEEEGGATWKLAATLTDLESALRQAEGDDAHRDLQRIYERLSLLKG
jgi:hypothetical protein